MSKSELHERKQFVSDCTAGERSALDGLTPCERRLLTRLRDMGYELVRSPDFPRYIRRPLLLDNRDRTGLPVQTDICNVNNSRNNKGERMNECPI
jgi:hypothetical protein